MAYVIYTLKNGQEEKFGPFNSEELNDEIEAAAEVEIVSDGTYVASYRVENE